MFKEFRADTSKFLLDFSVNKLSSFRPRLFSIRRRYFICPILGLGLEQNNNKWTQSKNPK